MRKVASLLLLIIINSSYGYDETPLADQPIFTDSRVPANVALALSVEYPTAEILSYRRDTYSPDVEYLGNWDPDKCYAYLHTDDPDIIFFNNQRLFNSGVDGYGNSRDTGLKDLHWSVIDAPSGVNRNSLSMIDNNQYGAYLGFGQSGNVPPGHYTFRSDSFTFAPDIDPEDVSIQFALHADDSLVSVSVNSQIIPVSTNPLWYQAAWVRLPKGSFSEATNTISITISNHGDSNNYTGIVVDQVEAFIDGYFRPVARSNNRTCDSFSGARWSGNFLNHIATHTIDPLKIAMSGGYRSVDKVDQTILDKGWSSREYYGGGAKVVSGSGIIAGATPYSAESLSVVANNYGNRFLIYTGNDHRASDKSSEFIFADSSDNDNASYYLYYGRAEVCVPGLLEDNCSQYPDGNFKPTGVIQKYDQELRFAAFGYLNDGDYNRDGGVLRAAMAPLGPTYLDEQRTILDNPQAEWDAGNGIFEANPNPSAAAASGVSKSGVINYLNEFGISSNSYKAFDPVSELYYTALRYLRGKDNIPEYTDNLTDKMVDGFPVYTEWDDPIQYSCQKNYVVGIGDSNTHGDYDLPGRTANRGWDTHSLPASIADDATINVSLNVNGGGTSSDNNGHKMNVGESTNYVGFLEGGAHVGLADAWANGDATVASFYMAGLAYDVRARDFRMDFPGNQSIRTYWLDVLEDGSGRSDGLKSQFWLTAKYGGFVPVDDQGDTVILGDFVSPYALQPSEFKDSFWDTNGDGDPDNYYRADNPQAMIAGLNDAFKSISIDANQPSSALKAESPFVYTSDVVLSSSYITRGWAGEVNANVIEQFDANGAPIFRHVWEGGDKLSQQSNRNIFTSECSGESSCSGVPFVTAALSPEYRNLLMIDGDDFNDVVQYIRGDRSNEEIYRKRASLLGDIVDSKVVVVGAPALPYADLTNPGYSEYRQTMKNRVPVAYVGANDGMLHAFEATDDGETGGREIFAFIPSAVIGGPDDEPDKSGLRALLKPDYEHRAYVDAIPVAVDVDFDKDPDEYDWRTILVGGLGKGGRAIYALDVTDPDSINSDASAAETMLWEFADEDLGFTFGKPIVVKVNIESKDFSGWVVIIGSGYNNDDGNGYFFVIDAVTGDLIEKVATPSFTTGIDAGLAHVNAYIPSFGDYIADAAYAGDLRGNLWRLNLTDLTVARLGVLEGSNSVQLPVTTPPMIEPSYSDNKRHVIVATGKLLDRVDSVNNQTHTVFGFIDGEKNRQTTFAAVDIARRDLEDVSRSFEDDGGETDIASNNGWYLDLDDQYRVTTEMISGNGFVVVAANRPEFGMCVVDNDSNGTSRLYALSLSEGRTLFDRPYEEFDSLAKEVNIYRSPNSNGPRINITTEKDSEEVESTLNSALPPDVRLINWRNIINSPL